MKHYVIRSPFKIALLFNANKAYDRQVIEGIGEYVQSTTAHWDILINDDFRFHLETLNQVDCDGIIADLDDIDVLTLLAKTTIPLVGVGGSYHNILDYPATHYIATDNQQLITSAFLHLKHKGLTQFAFYGLPAHSPLRWAHEREYAFRQLMTEYRYPYQIYHGVDYHLHNWDNAQYQLADWLHSLPNNTGIIAVTDARARHILQVCEHIKRLIPEQLALIGIDNEELTGYLCRTGLSSVVQGTKQMGFRAAKLLHRLLNKEPLPLQRILIPPQNVIERASTDFHSFDDPVVSQALHFIRHHACHGIKAEQVIDFIGFSRTLLEKRFKNCLNLTIHDVIYRERINHAKHLLIDTKLPLSSIAKACGYPSIQYFYYIFKKNLGLTPSQYRNTLDNQRNDNKCDSNHK